MNFTAKRIMYDPVWWKSSRGWGVDVPSYTAVIAVIAVYVKAAILFAVFLQSHKLMCFFGWSVLEESLLFWVSFFLTFNHFNRIYIQQLQQYASLCLFLLNTSIHRNKEGITFLDVFLLSHNLTCFFFWVEVYIILNASCLEYSQYSPQIL